MPIKGKVSKALEWGQEGDINGTVDEAITRFLAAFGKKKYLYISVQVQG